MSNPIEPFLSQESIQRRVEELGLVLNQEYQNSIPLVIGLLKGVLPFYADLCRQFKGDLEMDFMQVSSYGNSTSSSGKINIVKNHDKSIKGRRVLLVDDIIDTGLTLFEIKEHLLRQGPEDIRLCVLLDKPSRRALPINADYVGFEIPDHFVVGYGLDYQERYRQLPYVGIYKP